MLMETKTLSSKIVKTGIPCYDGSENLGHKLKFYKPEDVKDFIQKLKKEFDDPWLKDFFKINVLHEKRGI